MEDRTSHENSSIKSWLYPWNQVPNTWLTLGIENAADPQLGVPRRVRAAAPGWCDPPAMAWLVHLRRDWICSIRKNRFNKTSQRSLVLQASVAERPIALPPATGRAHITPATSSEGRRAPKRSV